MQNWAISNTIAVQTPACGYSITLSVDSATTPSILSYSEGSTISFTVQSNSGGFSSSYNIKITATP